MHDRHDPRRLPLLRYRPPVIGNGRSEHVGGGDRERDKATGRPIRDGREVVSELTDNELAEELVVAAMARDGQRFERFNALLTELTKRRD